LLKATDVMPIALSGLLCNPGVDGSKSLMGLPSVCAGIGFALGGLLGYAVIIGALKEYGGAPG